MLGLLIVLGLACCVFPPLALFVGWGICGYCAWWVLSAMGVTGGQDD